MPFSKSEASMLASSGISAPLDLRVRLLEAKIDAWLAEQPVRNEVLYYPLPWTAARDEKLLRDLVAAYAGLWPIVRIASHLGGICIAFSR
jgi:hypothetical protein